MFIHITSDKRMPMLMTLWTCVDDSPDAFLLPAVKLGQSVDGPVIELVGRHAFTIVHNKNNCLVRVGIIKMLQATRSRVTKVVVWV